MGKMQDKPWITESGGTDEKGFLEAYTKNNNIFWGVEPGHLQNILDYLINENNQMRALLQTIQHEQNPPKK